MGVDLVDLMKENDSKWKESVHSEHPGVFTFILGKNKGKYDFD